MEEAPDITEKLRAWSAGQRQSGEELFAAVYEELRQSQIVELRFFDGLTVAETAAYLKISANTVSREWNVAKAWLYRQIKS